MINKNGIPWLSKLALAILILSIVIGGLQLLHPWQRHPTVFYDPFILPIEVICGDIIILYNGEYIVPIGHDMRIDSIEYKGGVAIIHSTQHMTLWELLVRGK